MKLSTGKRLTVALAAATNTLLSSVPAKAAGFGLLNQDQWKTEAALLIYSEPGRVSALEPVIQATRIIDTDESISFKLTVDTLTGASASGAVPSTQPQTYTKPSGNGAYTTDAGDIPLDDTFEDDRVALNVAWKSTLDSGVKWTLGANISNEYDYKSIGANSLFEFAIYQNNTTLSAGLSVAADSIDPVGGVPVPFNRMAASGTVYDRESIEDKQVADLLFGFTQIINARSLFQINLGFSSLNGYQSDPYKIISVVDNNGDVVMADAQANRPLAVFEHRPDSRNKQVLYGKYKRNINNSILDTAYRFTTDSWGIQSHTLEFSLRYPLTRGWIQPRLRLYKQSAADFYTPFILENDVPAISDDSIDASADYRLGELSSYTVGLEYGRSAQRNWSVALEYYLQQSPEPDKFGSLNSLTLTPDVDAVMVRFGTTF